MPRREMTLRQLLRSGQPDSALVRITSREPLAPEDELLRALYGGLISHYTGAYEGSTHSLERAVDLAEDRYTKRISRATLSLVSSDLVLPYEPSLTERALIHYRSEEHTSELQSRGHLVCRLLLEKKKYH